MKRLALSTCALAIASLPFTAGAAQTKTKMSTAAKAGTTAVKAATPAPKASASTKAPASFEVEALKLCSAIKGKQCASEQSTFTTGSKAWVWLKLRPKGDNAKLRLRWSVNGKPVWTMGAKPVRLGRTWYYKTIEQPGNWTVDVLGTGDQPLKSASLTATSSAPAAATATAGSAKPAAAAAASPKSSPHFAVAGLQLTTQIKDRKPVSPSTTFKKGDKLFAWVKLDVKDPQTTVRFKWYVGGSPVYTSNPTTVKQSPSWRTWGSKTLDQAGNWKVEVLDADGTVVKTQDFTVQ